jgi:hypothetical protein
MSQQVYVTAMEFYKSGVKHPILLHCMLNYICDGLKTDSSEQGNK